MALEQGSSDTVQPFTRVFNLCNTRGVRKHCKDSRTIRPNTCSVQLDQSITKQPAHRPRRAHLRHQSQSEASDKSWLFLTKKIVPPLLAKPNCLNCYKQTQRLRQGKTNHHHRLTLATPLICAVIHITSLMIGVNNNIGEDRGWILSLKQW